MTGHWLPCCSDKESRNHTTEKTVTVIHPSQCIFPISWVFFHIFSVFFEQDLMPLVEVQICHMPPCACKNKRMWKHDRLSLSQTCCNDLFTVRRHGLENRINLVSGKTEAIWLASVPYCSCFMVLKKLYHVWWWSSRAIVRQNLNGQLDKVEKKRPMGQTESWCFQILVVLMRDIPPSCIILPFFIYIQPTCFPLVLLYDTQIYEDTVADQLLLEFKSIIASVI